MLIFNLYATYRAADVIIRIVAYLLVKSEEPEITPACTVVRLTRSSVKQQ